MNFFPRRWSPRPQAPLRGMRRRPNVLLALLPQAGLSGLGSLGRLRLCTLLRPRETANRALTFQRATSNARRVSVGGFGIVSQSLLSA